MGPEASGLSKERVDINRVAKDPITIHTLGEVKQKTMGYEQELCSRTMIKGNDQGQEAAANNTTNKVESVSALHQYFTLGTSCCQLCKQLLQNIQPFINQLKGGCQWR